MSDMTAVVVAEDRTLAVKKVQRPTPGMTEVLIKAAAVGVNPVDWKTLNGAPVGEHDPDILGWDVAGEVVEVGVGVTRFAVGDRVFGMPRFPGRANAYAEYVVAGSREVARIPDGIDDVTAGGTPLAGLTAWQAIVDTLHVKEGDRVLIHAASGGVGHLAVQIAKSRGAEVWGTASAENQEALEKLGLDHFIDYKSTRFEEVAVEMDAVLDLVGLGDNPVRSVKCLKPGGKLVVIPSPDQIPPKELLDEAGVTATWMLVEYDYASMEKLAQLMSDGTLKVVIAETRPLTEIAELHKIGQAGGPMGKLVATVN